MYRLASITFLSRLVAGLKRLRLRNENVLRSLTLPLPLRRIPLHLIPLHSQCPPLCLLPLPCILVVVVLIRSRVPLTTLCPCLEIKPFPIPLVILFFVIDIIIAVLLYFLPFKLAQSVPGMRRQTKSTLDGKRKAHLVPTAAISVRSAPGKPRGTLECLISQRIFPRSSTSLPV